MNLPPWGPGRKVPEGPQPEPCTGMTINPGIGTVPLPSGLDRSEVHGGYPCSDRPPMRNHLRFFVPPWVLTQPSSATAISCFSPDRPRRGPAGNAQRCAARLAGFRRPPAGGRADFVPPIVFFAGVGHPKLCCHVRPRPCRPGPSCSRRPVGRLYTIPSPSPPGPAPVSAARGGGVSGALPGDGADPRSRRAAYTCPIR